MDRPQIAQRSRDVVRLRRLAARPIPACNAGPKSDVANEPRLWISGLHLGWSRMAGANGSWRRTTFDELG